MMDARALRDKQFVLSANIVLSIEGLGARLNGVLLLRRKVGGATKDYERQQDYSIPIHFYLIKNRRTTFRPAMHLAIIRQGRWFDPALKFKCDRLVVSDFQSRG